MPTRINSKNYPEYLRMNKQWVNMKVTRNEAKNKYDKGNPMNSRSGMSAKWSNPECWSPVEDAETMNLVRPDAIPTYIICKKDELVVIDCDNCYDGEQLMPYAQYLVDLFQSYTERSVSGNGIHIFVHGDTELSLDTIIIHEGQEHKIEVFTDKHMITLTGDIIDPDLNDIQDGEEALEKLEAMVKPKPKMTVTVGQGNQTSSLTSDQELKKLSSALETLPSGSYGDWLGCGMALKLYGSQHDCEAEVWDLFNEWSQSTETNNYDQQKNREAWSSWDTTETGEKQVTIGSIYHKAREAGWTFDNRSLTSSANGKKGGAPSLQHADTARDFFDETMVDEASGYPTVRYCDGKWYGFNSEGWSLVPPERILSCIATFMQNDSLLEDRCSGNYFRSVRDNLASFNLCATTCTMPSMLDTGETADHWLAFSDGVMVNMLDLAKVKVGQLVLDESEYIRPVSPALFSKAFVGYPLNTEDRSMPLFRKYLDKVLPDPESQKMAQQMAGLMLTDETCYESAFALVGSGANGKTVYLDVLTALIGRQNVSSVDLHTLDQRFQTFPLVESKLNICGEMPTDIGVGNLHKVEGILKHCISGGQIEVELKGVNKTVANCRARFAFATNSMPTFVDKSDGIWRRLKVIDFPVTIPREERDVHLADKIIESELPGVLLWALEGLVDIVSTGEVYESETSLQMKQQHQLDSDREKSFLLERCCLGVEAFVSKEALYEDYRDWCAKSGRGFPQSKIRFLRRVMEIHPMLQDKQMQWDESLKRTRCLCGLGFQPEEEEFDYAPYKEPKAQIH